MEQSGQSAPGSIAALLEAVVHLAPVPMLVADRHHRLLAANRAFRELTGLGRGPAEWAAWSHRLGAGNRRRLAEESEQVFESGLPACFDLQLTLPDGPRWTRWWVQKKEAVGCAMLVMAVIDVHEDLAQKRDLHELATRDDLTGLVNRRFFVETVEQALLRTERFPERVCLLYIDLDGFKRVNDLGGHAMGDRVLAAIAWRLRQVVRSGDMVGRIGGDEFAVLIERLTSAGEAAIVARRVEEALNGSVEVDGEEWPIAASVGITLSRAGDDAFDLLKRGDEAMYEVKRTKSRPTEDGPAPAGAPPDRSVVDVRHIQDEMENVRRSLEALLEDLELGD